MRLITNAIVMVLVLTATSCKKTKVTKEPDPGVTSGPAVKKKWLPVKLESSQLVISFQYSGTGGQLSEISGSDGYATSITYKNDQPFELNQSRNKIPFQLVDYIKTKANEPKARVFDQTGNVYVPTGSYVLTYDDKNQLTKVKNYNSSGELFRESNLYYASDNINRVRILDYPDSWSEEVYLTDNKNSIFKQVLCTDRLFLESRYFFFRPGPNNVTRISDSKSPGSDVIFSYTYNADEYPSEMTVTKDNRKQVFKVSYIELK